ncbi:chlororespiratory reduction protein 7 [Pseudomonas sp. HMWF031]|nr:chlororespiratory reduction protein 7 [Pseudomonas sp. HMWF031]
MVNSTSNSLRFMSDPLIRSLDHYVVLVPGESEQLLTAAATLTWLTERLTALNPWPEDLRGCDGASEAAERLLDTACELETSPGVCVQWYAVRLEPPQS